MKKIIKLFVLISYLAISPIEASDSCHHACPANCPENCCGFFEVLSLIRQLRTQGECLEQSRRFRVCFEDICELTRDMQDSVECGDFCHAICQVHEIRCGIWPCIGCYGENTCLFFPFLDLLCKIECCLEEFQCCNDCR